MVRASIFLTISETDLITVLHLGPFLLGPFLYFLAARVPHVSILRVR